MIPRRLSNVHVAYETELYESPSLIEKDKLFC